MGKSLFTKIFLTQIAGALLVLALVIPAVFMMIGEFFVSNNKEAILQDASRVATLTSQVADIQGDEHTWNFFRQGIEFVGGQSTVLVTNFDGAVIAAPENTQGINIDKIDKKFIEVVENGKSVVRLYSKGEIFNQQTLVAIVPIEKYDVISKQGKFLGAAIAMKSMPQIREIQNRLLRIVLLAQLVAWIVAFMVSSVLTSQIIKPIKRMRTAAKSIASGNFKERIPITSSDEVGQLAESFNSMTQSLEELENMRSSFISDVSHELRTPMTTISGFVEGILDGTIPEEKREKYLSTVLEETKRLSRLVNDLLEASRLEQGKINVNKEDTDINRIVAEAVFSYEKQILDKKIDVNLNLDGNECRAMADGDSIKRVMINLIDNAIKFTPECGKISVETKNEGRKVYVSVQNSGDGIEKDDLRHIWERFYKTDKSRSQDKKGVGLGLHIVKTIITQHGGEIFAESELGEYTKFTFVLDTGSKNNV